MTERITSEQVEEIADANGFGRKWGAQKKASTPSNPFADSRNYELPVETMAEAYKRDHDFYVGERDTASQKLDEAAPRLQTVERIGGKVLDVITDLSSRHSAREELDAQLSPLKEEVGSLRKEVRQNENDRILTLEGSRDHYKDNAFAYKVAAVEDALSATPPVQIQLGDNPFDQAAQAKAQQFIQSQQQPPAPQ